MLKKTILIIEDDKPIREMMRNILEIEGYSVVATANGKEAVDALARTPRPNLILLDMMMPVMNGWQFLDFMRANSSTVKVPVVVVSAYHEIAKSVKPSAVVTKPVQLRELLDAITRCAA